MNVTKSSESSDFSPDFASKVGRKPIVMINHYTTCERNRTRSQSLSLEAVEMDAKMRIQISYIVMERVDGPDAKTIRVPQVFRGFRAADNYIKDEALSAPKAEDQTDEMAFVVMFMDGDTYSGTYHLRRGDALLTRNFSQHIRQYAEWFSSASRDLVLPSFV